MDVRRLHKALNHSSRHGGGRRQCMPSSKDTTATVLLRFGLCRMGGASGQDCRNSYEVGLKGQALTSRKRKHPSGYKCLARHNTLKPGLMLPFPTGRIYCIAIDRLQARADGKFEERGLVSSESVAS